MWPFHRLSRRYGTRFYAIVYTTGRESGPLPYKLFAVGGDKAREVSVEEHPEFALAEDERRRA